MIIRMAQAPRMMLLTTNVGTAKGSKVMSVNTIVLA